jgi:hypothetical protein
MYITGGPEIQRGYSGRTEIVGDPNALLGGVTSPDNLLETPSSVAENSAREETQDGSKERQETQEGHDTQESSQHDSKKGL